VENVNKSRLKSNMSFFTLLVKLTRVQCYTEFLFMLIPIFSLLFSQGLVLSPSFVLLSVPFAFLFAAGAIYNFIRDVDFDSAEKNPFAKGALSKQRALIFLLAFFIASIVSFLLLYQSLWALLFFSAYVFFTFSYSGLKFRFKETLASVVVASFVLWIAAPLIVLAEFEIFSREALVLLLFITLTYTGREIHHTLLDYKKDLEKGCKTFAIKVGRKNAIFIENMLLFAGLCCILFNSASSSNPLLIILSSLYGLGYVVSLVFQVLFHKLSSDSSRFDFLTTFGRWPFFLSRFYLLALSLIYLQFSPVASLIVIWVYLTTKHY
jgi:4-hydroxybenzoate polyprenyltransferase